MHTLSSGYDVLSDELLLYWQKIMMSQLMKSGTLTTQRDFVNLTLWLWN